MTGSEDRLAERVIEGLGSYGFHSLADRDGEREGRGGSWRDLRMTLGGPCTARLNRDRDGNWNAWFGETGERDTAGEPRLFLVTDWIGVVAGRGNRQTFAEQAEFLIEHLAEMCNQVTDSPQLVARLRSYGKALAVRLAVEAFTDEERKLECLSFPWTQAQGIACREVAASVAGGSLPADREMFLTAFTVLVASAIDTGPGEWEAATACAIVERAVGPDGDIDGFLDAVAGIVGSVSLAPYREIIQES